MPVDYSQLSRPGADPVYQQGAQRARDLALLRIAGAAPVGAPAPAPEAKGAAVAQATAAGAGGALQQAAADVQKFRGQAQLSLGQQQLRDQGQQFDAGLAQQTQAVANEDVLAGLDLGVKRRIFDDRIAFKQQQIGQGALEASQLVDWAATKARSKEELAGYTQEVQQATEKQLQVMQAGYDMMAQTLKAETEGRIQQLDQQTKLEVTEAMGAFKRQIEEAQAKKAAQQQLMTGVLTVAGAGAGAVVGGPMGAVAGGSAGGGIGSILGGSGAV